MERSFILSYRFLVIIALGLHFLNSSCRSPKEIIYFQDISTAIKDTIDSYSIHKIQPNDILEIGVNSLNSNSDEQFARGFISYNESTNRVPGYMVDINGNVTLPFAGEVYIQGYSLTEARKIITQKLDAYLKNPVVNIRIANFRVSVIGEVANPGTYIIKEEKVSIPSALSLAGDLTIFAKRKNVLLIREENGVRTYKRIDLTKSEIMSSPDYYLRSNDVLYIEPSRSKVSQNDTRTWQLLSFVATLAALTSVIVSNLTN